MSSLKSSVDETSGWLVQGEHMAGTTRGALTCTTLVLFRFDVRTSRRLSLRYMIGRRTELAKLAKKNSPQTREAKICVVDFKAFLLATSMVSMALFVYKAVTAESPSLHPTANRKALKSTTHIHSPREIAARFLASLASSVPLPYDIRTRGFTHTRSDIGGARETW